MKKIGLLLVFAQILLLPIGLSAQNGWFDNNPQWVNYLNSSWRGEGVEYISVQGDTVVQGYPAKILRRFEDMNNSADQTRVRIARQSGDTIWCLNHPTPNLNHFYIHYNFSLGIGDSIAVPTYYGGGSLRIKYIITDTGSLTIGTQNLRFQEVDLFFDNAYVCNARIIETIGMVNTGCQYNGPNPWLWRWEHFFIDEPNDVFIDGQNWFFCQFQNDLIEFELDDNTCEGLTNVIGPEITEPVFTIAPNPFQETVFLRSEPSVAIQYLRVFNAAGQIVLEKEQPSGAVDAGRLIPGIYHFQIISKSGEQFFVRAVRQ